MNSPRDRRSREIRAMSAPPRPAGDGGAARLQLVARLDEDLGSVGEEEVDAGPEADQADPLPADELVAHAGIEHDPPRQRARDLLEREASGRGHERDPVLLVLDRRLVRERGLLAPADVRVVAQAP